MNDHSTLTERKQTRAEQILNMVRERLGRVRSLDQGNGTPVQVDQQAKVQDVLSGLALNALTAFGRIDPHIYIADPSGKSLRLQPDLKPKDEATGLLLSKAFASVKKQPLASVALALGRARALRACEELGCPQKVYNVKVDALSTFDSGKPFYRFRVVGDESPTIEQWEKVFFAQYVLPQHRTLSGQLPAVMDARSGLMFSTAGVLCHNFTAAEMELIEDWVDDCCKFNGKRGKVVKVDADTMKCKI